MKTASRIFLTFSLLAFFAGMTFGQMASTTSPAKTSTKAATAAPGKFVDTNNNGICDKHEAKGANCQGKTFVDKNGDGKCDNCGSTGKCNGTGCGQGQKQGNGCGKGQGNGNCCGNGQGKGNGCSQGQSRHGCSNQGNTPAAEPKK